MSGGLATISHEIDDYAQVASDLRVGVNHMALDEERSRQERFFEGILDLQKRIMQSEQHRERYGEQVEELKNCIRLNADVLTYLKSITKLEGPLTELTTKLTTVAVEASSPNAAPATVFANKALTENVANCWEYVAQLFSITQVHLNDAASYQKFHHTAHEVDAHIDKMVGLAEMKMLLFDPQGTIEEALMLANELEDDNRAMTLTWDKTCQLAEMGRRLRPIQNRNSKVVSGRTVNNSPKGAPNVVMVKALINFSGPDFAIRKGEEMILVNNENPNFWRVRTTFGEREVPSVIFTTIGPNQEEVFKADSLQKKCVSDWKRVLERTKGKLVKYYTTLFERFCKNDAVYFAHEDQMNEFLDDVDNILIAPNYDSGFLQNAYETFTETLMLLSSNRRPPRGAVTLTEGDIRAIHAPLRKIKDQANQVDRIQARVSMNAEEVQRYLKSVEDERQHIFNEIARMEKVQKEKEDQLKHLADRVNSFRHKRKAIDRAISDYTSEPVGDLLKYFPSTPLTKPLVVENDYRGVGDRDETDIYEPSGKSRLQPVAIENSPVDYGSVARQMVATHSRPKAKGVTFSGGVVGDRGGGTTWAGTAKNLKRSASTNDLQTQIRGITVSASTQYEPPDNHSSWTNGLKDEPVPDDTSKRRPITSIHDNRLVLADAEISYKKDRYQKTSDVQAQIRGITKSAGVQVGVRVLPKAIDLKQIEIGNLGLEIQDTSEAAGLGLRVGQVLCPVTIGTAMDLYEGPGIQVLGINDVDSLNLELRHSIAHATTDMHNRLKVRDVQAQIFTRSDNMPHSTFWDNLVGKRPVSETQLNEAQFHQRSASVQAVAAMEVVNISSNEPKKSVTEGAVTTFCVLPDNQPRQIGHFECEPANSVVMSQISCLLQSRGIHSDLQTYLSDYKQRHGIVTETSDLCTQINVINKDSNLNTDEMGNKPSEPQNKAFSTVSEGTTQSMKTEGATSFKTEAWASTTVDNRADPEYPDSQDAQTLIKEVVNNATTQVSSKLIPTEVTVSQIETKNIEMSFINQLQEANLNFPFDSVLCPAEMKFQTELYEGSELAMADYNDLGNILVTHGGSVARGSFKLDSTSRNNEDVQTQIISDLKAPAAVLLRTGEVDRTKRELLVGEATARSKYVPRLKLVVTDVTVTPHHQQANPPCDLQTQISSVGGPKGTDDSILSETEFVGGASSVVRKNLTTENGYSTQKDTNFVTGDSQVNVKDASEQTFSIVSSMVCAQCGRKSCDLQNQTNTNVKNELDYRSVAQTREDNVIADVQSQVKEDELSAAIPGPKPRVRGVDAFMQVAVELVPTEINMSHCDIEDMQLEFEDVDKQVNSCEVYKMRMKSVTCPARLKVQTRLTEGSGVHVVGIQDTRKIGFSVTSTPTKFLEGNVACVGGTVNDELQSLVAFEHPIKTATVAARSRNSSRSIQRSLIRLIPCEIDSRAAGNAETDSQNFRITTTVSTQVGTRLIPQAIGIAPISMENMEVSVASKVGVQEESLSAPAILYPVDIELAGKLTDGKSGFEIVSLAQVEALQLNTSEKEAHLHYKHAASTNANIPHPNTDLQTQIESTDATRDKPHVLPASIVMQTKQFAGRHRAPELVSQSFVGSLLSDAREHGALTLRAASAPSMSIGASEVALVNQTAYLTKEQSTQAVGTETPKVGQEVYLPLQRPAASAVRKSESVQVGMKMVAKSLEVSQIPVRNLQLESTAGSSEQNVSYTLDSLRCPAKITLQTELCEESGIQVCSLDQAKEIDVGLVNELTHTSTSARISSKENSTRQRSLKAGWWSSIISGRTPPVESKSIQNAVVELPSQGIQVSSKDLLSKECNLILEAEASLSLNSSVNSTEVKVPTSSSSTGQQFKLVMTNTSNQAHNTKTTILAPEGAKAKDCEIQVGIKLIPNSVKIRSIEMENMELVITDKKSTNMQRADVSAILCSSGIKYDEVLTESTGIELVDINDTNEVEINYNKAAYNASVISTKNKKFTSESISLERSQRHDGKLWNTMPQTLQSTYFEGPKGLETKDTTTQFETRLRVKGEAHTTEQSLQNGVWPDINKVKMEDGVVQVGLNLVPRIVEVKSIAVENLDVVKESREQSTCDQVGVSAMLCTTATGYDEVLVESRGVSVVPINEAQEMQITHGGSTYYTTVETQKRVPTLGSYSGCRNQVPDVESRGTRLRVRHAEYSADGDRQNRATYYDKGRSVERIDGSTQVGAVFVPTELTMQQMTLDTHQVPGLSRSVSEKSVFCPVGMNISTVLTESSGVQIADVKNTSEIAIQMHQDKYTADITTDSTTNQTRISLKEKSITMAKQPSSAHISLIDPAARRSDTIYANQVELSGRTFGSTTTRLNSRSVQVGTLLVPTTITMEKVNVENLEIEVPLSPGRHAGVNVSAVLASSATEMTSILTNASGIQVVPMKNVDEIGIQMGGKTYVGTVETSPSDRTTRTSHTSGVLRDANLELKRDMQHIVLPLRTESGTSQISAQAEGLLSQSTDLSKLHDVLRSREATPSLRITTSTSSPLHSRPGLLKMSGDLITPVTESMVESSLPAVKEMKDGEVQVGLKLIPQTVKVQHVKVENMEAVVAGTKSNESKQLDVRALLCSSAVQYDQVLSDSTGVDVLPIAEAKEVSLEHGRNRFVTTVSANGIQMQVGSYEGVGKGPVDKTIKLNSTSSSTSTNGGSTEFHDSEFQPILRVRHAEYSVTQTTSDRGNISGQKTLRVNMTTQVGAVLVPLELSMQKMALDSSRVEASTGFSKTGLHSVLCPTEMEATVALCDAPGIKLANVQGDLAVQYNNTKYSADVISDSVGTSSCVRLLEKSISLGRGRSGLSLALCKPRFEGSSVGSLATRESYYNSANKRVTSVSSQVGTLLVPTKIHMDKVDVEHLAVDIPVTEGDTVDMKVSAILASSATEMVPVITDTTGIQVVEMKDVEEVGIQLDENVYVTNVVPASSKRMAGASGVSRDFRIGSTDHTQKQDSIVIPIQRTHQASQMTQRSRTILQQSAELKAVTSILQSSEVQPKLRKASVTAGWSPKCLNTSNRAGPLGISADLITPVTESMVESSLPAVRAMRDSGVQVGLKLIPQTFEVEHVRVENMNVVHTPFSGHEQVSNVAGLIYSAGLHYDQVLSDSVGVQVEPIQAADAVRIRDGGTVFHAAVISDRDLANRKDPSTHGTAMYVTSVSGKPNASMEGETTLHVCHTESACDRKSAMFDAAMNNEISRQSAAFSFAPENLTYSTCRNCGRRKVETGSKDSTDLVIGGSSASLHIPTSHCDASVQVGLQIIPKSVKLDSVAVENLLLEVKDENMATNLEFPVGSIFYPSEIEADAVLNECGGIEMQEVDTIREVVVEHGGERRVADVYFSPLKKMVGSFESMTSGSQEPAQVSRKQQQTALKNKSLSIKTATVILPNSQSQNSNSFFKTGPMTIRSLSNKPRILLSGRRKQVMRVRTDVSAEPTGALESRIFTCPCGRLYSSINGKNRPLNVSCNACGASGVVVVEGSENVSQKAVEPAYTLIQRPKLEKAKSADWYHVACEAQIQPEMLSKRLTAKIFVSSTDVGTQFYGSVQDADDVPNETIVLFESNIDSTYRQITSETTYHPLTQGTTINRVKSTGNLKVQQTNMVHMSTQCTIIHRDSLAAVSATKISGVTGFHQSGSPYAEDIISLTLDSAKKGETFGKSQRRTLSADSRAQGRTGRICAKCHNKVNNVEIHAPESDAQTITIDMGPMENAVRISEPTLASRTSVLRRNFFAGSTSTRSSEFIDTAGTQTDAARCAICRAELTSGDLTTSISSSTSSLADFETMANVETKEIVEAFTRVNRAKIGVGSSAKGRQHLSLYQTLKENRIIQAVISDYEVEKGGASSQLSVEAKELVDIMAPTGRQTALSSSKPPAYFELQHNMLARKVVESYEDYKRVQERDNFIQTDESHRSGMNPADYTRSLSTDSQAHDAARQIIEVVSTFGRRQSQIPTMNLLYTNLKTNPIIQQVIRDYEKEKCERQGTLKEALVQTEIPLTASIKTPIQSLDGQVAILEAEQFAPATAASHGGSSISKRVKKRRPINEPLSSSISSDSSGDELIEVLSRPQWSPLHISDTTKYDVACSALITPEVWEKRIQVDTITGKR